MSEMKTVQEMNEELKKDAERMSVDLDLKDAAQNILIRADHYRWIHQTKWMGVPVLQTPEDLLQIQEIIWKMKPDVIIECGVAFGGGTLFLASLMNNLDGSRMVVGIDLYIPQHLIDIVNADHYNSEQDPFEHTTKFSWVELIEGSSTEIDVVEKVAKICYGKKAMVILDSNHSHEHVLNELRIYSAFVQKGGYIVVSDTWADVLSADITARQRPWGPGNSPRSAMQEFLKGNKDFEIDKQIQNKLLISTNPDGYLVKKK